MKDQLYYSASTHGFYRRSLHGGNVPADAVAVTTKHHAALIAGQAAGGKIVPDEKGHPTLVTAPAPTIEQLRGRAQKRIRREAGRRIEAAVPIWRQLNDAAEMARALHAGADLPAAALARRDKIDALRTRSNVLEQRAACASAEDLAALDPADAKHWIVA